MESKENKPEGFDSKCKVENPVLQMRPDESAETIDTPPTNLEVQQAVEEMNPDENSMNSRG